MRRCDAQSKPRGRGRLKLKGEISSAKKRKRVKNAGSSAPEETEECSGSGRIVSSGVTIHGFETKFKEEVHIGDALILFHPKALEDESRIVVAILSQRSLSINAPFSTDVASTTAYRIRKESVFLVAKASEALAHASVEEEDATGAPGKKPKQDIQDEISRQLQKKLDKARPVLKYREKTGMWGYRTVTERVPKSTSAEEILDMRAKRQGRDKYCW